MIKKIKNRIFVVIGALLLMVLAFGFLMDTKEKDVQQVEVEKKVTQKKSSFLFVGDMMLARGVRQQTNINGLDYLFENIAEMFMGVDYVVGNLEGPIEHNAPKVKANSFSFVFDSEIIPMLKKYRFNVLSLANNHTNNFGGQSGFDKTVELLKNENIATFGHYTSCEDGYIYQDGNNYFVGINLTFGDKGCTEETVKNIQNIKNQNKDSFVVVMPHFGEEYESTANQWQRARAYQYIDAGADLIVGSHPHVIQDIEEYKGKLIFYSLGNFVFDQYFSEETQIGLGVRYDGVDYDLILVKGKKSSLSFVEGEERAKILEELAARSSDDLKIMIEKGKIRLND